MHNRWNKEEKGSFRTKNSSYFVSYHELLYNDINHNFKQLFVLGDLKKLHTSFYSDHNHYQLVIDLPPCNMKTGKMLECKSAINNVKMNIRGSEDATKLRSFVVNSSS